MTSFSFVYLRRLISCGILLISISTFQTAFRDNDEDNDADVPMTPLKNAHQPRDSIVVPIRKGQAQPLEFVHITKTGGTAVEKAGAAAGLNWGVCHWEKRPTLRCLHPDWQWTKRRQDQTFQGEWWHTPPAWLEPNPYRSSDSFTIVRNPYDRIISEYYCRYFGFHKQAYYGTLDQGEKQLQKQQPPFSRGQSQQLDRRIRANWRDHGPRGNLGRRRLFGNDGRQLEEKSVGYSSRGGMVPGLRYGPRPRQSRKDTPATLNGWIRKLLREGRVSDKTGHAMPQHLYVYDVKGHQVVSHVLRFENLESDFHTLMEEYGLSNVKLAPLKVNAGHTSLDEQRMTVKDLDSATISMINSFFKEDFERFGYDMISANME